MTKKRAPITVGEILKEEFLIPLGISQNRLSQETKIPTSAISQIINGKRAVTVETAMLIAKFFGTSAQFWINMQTSYDLAVAEDEVSLQNKLKDIKPLKRKLAAA